MDVGRLNTSVLSLIRSGNMAGIPKSSSCLRLHRIKEDVGKAVTNGSVMRPAHSGGGTPVVPYLGLHVDVMNVRFMSHLI